ncbi:MAG TPA: class I SAM-dependent methyltransferase [Flavitalea sp.]|nr:class I SAM-dependent methyltransferase [Flavitalea sp.]
MSYLSACPVCQETAFSSFLSCRDHTVSHETFHLEKCAGCGFVMTNPRPDENALSRYYESDAYISHSNKSLNVVDQVYKLSRTFTLKWKYNLVQKLSVTTPLSILDFGCGTGAFLAECRKHNMKISGVEPSATARTQAKEITGSEIASDLHEIKDDCDAITLWHVLEHVSALHETIEKLKDHLKENGTMFIAVPNLQSRDAKKYNEYWAGYDVPRHLWHFSRKTMEMVLAHHSLKLSNVVPMRLDAYYVSLLSEKYKNRKGGVANVTKAIIQGWKSNKAAITTQEYSSLIYIARK